MRILLSWLREFVEIPESPRRLADALTMAGLAVDAVAQEQGETVLELDVTPNRPDALSHLGVARDVGALFGLPVRRPQIRLAEDARPAHERASIEIADPDLCPRYTGRVAVGVTAGPAPDWMRRRLELCGIRSINNIADITNYVLLECGQPTHAFDLDTLRGPRIIARRARSGELLTTLDGVQRTLRPEQLVIADQDRAVALAGIMGGGETEITARTRNVLIESAFFEPASIRKTARQHGLHTEASHRFERGADIEAAPWANDRIACLLTELAGATVLRGRLDAYPSPQRRAAIPLRAAAVARHLGVEIPWDEVRRMLTSLDFLVEDGQVIPPAGRLDVEREIDLIEEIARIWGYDRFPLRLPEWSGESRPAENAAKTARVRQTARALGYDEAITYAFLSPAEAGQFGSWPAVPVLNPLSEFQNVMRNSAAPGMLRAIEWNLNRGQSDVRLFEIGRLYQPGPQGHAEPPVLALAATGRAGGKQLDFYDLKADVGRLLALFDGGVIGLDPETEASYYHPGHSARARLGGQAVARFGRIHPDLAAERKFRQPVFLAEIWLDRLLPLPLREPHYRPLPRVPPVGRDFSLLMPDGVAFGQIVEAVGQREYLVRLEPVEIFRGDQAPPGKYSLLLRAVWQRDDASLTDEQVNQYALHLVETLRHRFGAEQRT